MVGSRRSSGKYRRNGAVGPPRTSASEWADAGREAFGLENAEDRGETRANGGIRAGAPEGGLAQENAAAAAAAAALADMGTPNAAAQKKCACVQKICRPAKNLQTCKKSADLQKICRLAKNLQSCT